MRASILLILCPILFYFYAEEVKIFYPEPYYGEDICPLYIEDIPSEDNVTDRYATGEILEWYEKVGDELHLCQYTQSGYLAEALLAKNDVYIDGYYLIGRKKIQVWRKELSFWTQYVKQGNFYFPDTYEHGRYLDKNGLPMTGILFISDDNKSMVTE